MYCMCVQFETSYLTFDLKIQNNDNISSLMKFGLSPYFLNTPVLSP